MRAERLEEVRQQKITELKQEETSEALQVAKKLQNTSLARLTTKEYIEEQIVPEVNGYSEHVLDLHDQLCFENKENKQTVLDSYFDITYGTNQNGEKYIKSKTFVASRLAEDVTSDYPIAKNIDLGKVFVWNNGHWTLNAQDVFENESGNRLGEEFTRTRVNNAWEKANTQNLIRNKDWRSPSHKVNIVGGSYDYEKDKLVEKHPSDRFLHKIHYRYDEEAECPNFLNFLEEVLPEKEDRQKLLESLGLALLPDVHGKALLLTGEGANGKTLILKILDHLLEGGNTVEKGIHSLTQQFDIDNLYGKLAMTDEDMSGSKLSQQNVSFFKKMVGGGKIPAEEKYGDSYDFYPQVTPIFCANDIPPTPDRGKSFFRRWTIIKFPVTFSSNPSEDDPMEKQKVPEEKLLNPIINSDEEMRGILRLLIEKGVEAYNRDSQEVTGQRNHQEVKELWDEHSSPIYAFLKKAVNQGRHPEEAEFEESYSADWIRKDNLFKLTKAYAKQRSNKRITKNKITNALENLDYYFDERHRPRDNGERVMAYGGLKLKKYEVPENLHALINESSEQSVIANKMDVPLVTRVEDFINDYANTEPRQIETLIEKMEERELIAESEIDKFDTIIEELKSDGLIFEPSSGKVQSL